MTPRIPLRTSDLPPITPSDIRRLSSRPHPASLVAPVAFGLLAFALLLTGAFFIASGDLNQALSATAVLIAFGLGVAAIAVLFDPGRRG